MPDPSSLGPAPIPTAPTNRIMDRTLSPPRPTFRTTAILPSTHLPGSSSHQPVTAAPRCPAPSVLRRCSSLILTLYSDHQPYHSARPSPQRRLRFLPRRGRTARHRRPVMWHHAGYAGAAGPDGALEAFREHKFESERRDHGYWHWRHWQDEERDHARHRLWGQEPWWSCATSATPTSPPHAPADVVDAACAAEPSHHPLASLDDALAPLSPRAQAITQFAQHNGLDAQSIAQLRTSDPRVAAHVMAQGHVHYARNHS